MATPVPCEERIFICLKFGVNYRPTEIDKSNPNVLSDLHKHAEEIVSKSIGSLEESHKNNHHNIKLFVISPDHQPPSLKLLTRPSDLTPLSFVEIVIWRSDHETFPPPRDHILVKHNYKMPTYCSACHYFMWGIVKQGKRCKLCRRDFHHQCAEHLVADCPGRERKYFRVESRESQSTTITETSKNQIFTDQDLSNMSASSSKRKENRTHSKVPKPDHRLSPTHRTQSKLNLTEPKPYHNGGKTSSHSTDKSSNSRSTETSSSRDSRFSLDSESVEKGSIKISQRKDIKVTNCCEKDGIWTAVGQFGRESRHSHCTEILYDRKKFRFTKKDDEEGKHIIEIPAADIEAARSQSSENIFEPSSSQKEAYHKLACLLLDTINTAVQSKNNPKKHSIKIVSDRDNDTKDFSDLYEINEKEILGNGRFGIVFGGTMRKNGVHVAIKRVQVAKCTQKDRESIEQEAAYLFQLNHPGILKLEGIFDFEEHILLVTERLDTDMLNFILSNQRPKSRLSENTTRFLAFQLVAAIRYLHFKNIAHCDLKPDNVLINILPDDILHLKVGDFGYARTIHEHSIRYTKVGTIAYLAPEVSHEQWRHARGYNKTVDMWAIGVIIFVSLTGYFPFHDDMDILPQLENIPKFFQEEPFRQTTEEVKDLIHFRLLVPDAGHRMRSAGVIYHDWFQKSRHLFDLCRQLEECLKRKWLTLFFEETDSTITIPFSTADDSDSS